MAFFAVLLILDSSGSTDQKGLGTGMTALEELAQAIEQGHPNETEELVRKALEEGSRSGGACGRSYGTGHA